MTRSHRLLKAAAVAAALAVSSSLLSSAAAQDRVAEPFLGVRHIERYVTAPRSLYINVMEIDLSAPGLGFRLTPRVPGLANGDETITQTTRQFVEQQGAQLGINAHFFRLEHHSQARSTDNRSLAASDGDAYSPWDHELPVAFNISEDNIATLIRPGGGGGLATTPSVALYNAFAGNVQVVTDGRAATQSDLPRRPGSGFMADRHPRTAVGLTADNKLLLATVDGRQLAFSGGAYLDELGTIMRDLGAVNAINLDGGGSTTMVADYYGDADSHGASRGTLLVNSAVGRGTVGSERYNGTNLAIFAAPNPNYTPRQAPPPVPDFVRVLADFEQDEGTFSSGAVSGSNRNLNTDLTTIERITNDGYYGESAQRLAVATVSDDAFTAVRNLSGGGSPGNNPTFASTGSIGYFVKILNDVGDDEVFASLIIDDGSAHERAADRLVPADGEWHLVEWDLDNAADWNSFAGGNGMIDAASVTIDSMYVSSPSGAEMVVYWDTLAHNPNGSLSVLTVPEPASVALLLPLALLARRRRA